MYANDDSVASKPVGEAQVVPTTRFRDRWESEVAPFARWGDRAGTGRYGELDGVSFNLFEGVVAIFLPLTVFEAS